MTSRTPSEVEAAVTPNDAACVWCGSVDFMPWLEGLHDRLGHAPGTWEFARCKACGSGALHPFPRDADIAAFYPPIYTFAPEVTSKGSLSRLLAWIEYTLFFRTVYDVQVRKVGRAIGRQCGRACRLLDVGCGRGLRLKSFARQGYDVSGIDFDAGAVKYVRDQLGFSAICGDIGSAANHFPPTSFDVVTAFNVLEHVPDVQGTLAMFHRLLKPGGWLAAAVPLGDSMQSMVFGARWGQATEAPRHVSLPSRRGALGALAVAGFAPASIALAPDATMNCAAIAGLTLLPESATTLSYATGRRRLPWTRIAGAVVTLAAIPWALADAFLFRRPACGILFGRKPET